MAEQCQRWRSLAESGVAWVGWVAGVGWVGWLFGLVGWLGCLGCQGWLVGWPVSAYPMLSQPWHTGAVPE